MAANMGDELLEDGIVDDVALHACQKQGREQGPKIHERREKRAIGGVEGPSVRQPVGGMEVRFRQHEPRPIGEQP